MERNEHGLLDKARAKALKLWARFSDDEESEVTHTQEEIEASDDRYASADEARERVEHRGERDEYGHPNDRPDFEPPGSHPPSHRKLKGDRGPHGV